MVQVQLNRDFEIKIPFVRKSFNLITSGLASSYHEKTSLLSFTLPLLAATTLGDLTASAITTLVTQSLGIHKFRFENLQRYQYPQPPFIY